MCIEAELDDDGHLAIDSFEWFINGEPVKYNETRYDRIFIGKVVQYSEQVEFRFKRGKRLSSKPNSSLTVARDWPSC
jgi:hypothetical protein